MTDTRTFWLATAAAGVCAAIMGGTLGAALILALAPGAAWLSSLGPVLALAVALLSAALVMWGIRSAAGRPTPEG